MRKTLKISLAVLTFLLLAAAASAQQTQLPPPPPQQQGPPPKTVIHVGLVHLVAAVTDRRDKFVTDLTKNDFSVTEDGKKQDITYFARQADLPLRIGVLLDTSNSIRLRLHFEQDAAIDFLYNVIRRNRDQAFLMTFDTEPEVVQDYTDDVGELSEVIQKQNSGGGTALNDAIYAASQKLVSAPLAEGPNPDVRRVLVVISDGDDNLSDHPLSDAIQMADRAGVSIYAISSNNDWTTTDGTSAVKAIKSEGDKILEEYADETGGRVFFPYRVDDLAQSFLDIGTELRSQYLIGYSPPYAVLDGRFHSVNLRVDRRGLTVRSRKGYFAVAPVASISGQPGTGASPQK
ncbi:MAG TPA: VWA domain-containing protein [Candidatus Acidoferrales bacterium]|nr:VWA domain-containing protein [Candidatus Acidoferrales bacterium]